MFRINLKKLVTEFKEKNIFNGTSFLCDKSLLFQKNLKTLCTALKIFYSNST